MNAIKTLFILSLFVGVMLQSCEPGDKKNSSNETREQIPVTVVVLEKEEISYTIITSGKFTTDDETFLSFKTGGVIQAIHKSEGDAVRKGELLATLNLTEINAQVSQAELALEKARRDFARVTRLHADSVATLEQFQNAKTALAVAEQQFKAAKFDLSYSEIHALEDGYVLRKMANRGQVVQPGSSVFQVNGARQGKWKLKAAVSDKEWGIISLGDKATIQTDASSKVYLAVVTNKSGGVDPLTGSFTVELSLTTDEPFAIATGMFGKVTIRSSDSQDAWAVPYDALLDADGQSAFVFVTDDMETSRMVKVTILDIRSDEVMISEGLEKARALIVTGSAYLRDGSPIRIVEQPLE
jgi:RND family efflux transporter MFP subunit